MQQAAKNFFSGVCSHAEEEEERFLSFSFFNQSSEQLHSGLSNRIRWPNLCESRYRSGMAYASYSDFIAALESAGELHRISVPVATELEITEFADREMKSPGGGKALLFEKPTIGGLASKFPVAINTFGSRKRMAMSLGVESVCELADQMQLILKAKPPTSLKHAWKLAMQGLDLLNAKPKRVSSGPCKEVVHRFENGKSGKLKAESLPTLLDLPILQCWPKDGGRFITFPCVHARSGHGRAESRDVSDAGLRRPDDGHALAGPQGRRTPWETVLRARREDARRGDDRRGSGLYFRRDCTAAGWAG